MSKQQTTGSSLIKGLFLLLSVSVVCLGFSEIIIRVLYGNTTVMFPRYHTSAQYGDFEIRTIRSNMGFTHTSVDGSWEFETNEQGFRNKTSFEYAKSTGKLRVVSIGDSHTQGYEVDQDATYSNVIKRYLEDKDLEVEVFNTGVSGFSTAEALVLLEQELIKYQPDFVVLGFFANDYQDNLKSGLYGLSDTNDLEILKYKHIPGVKIQNFIYSIPGIQWLGENSYLYSVLFNSVWTFYKQRLAKSTSNKSASAVEPAAEEVEFAVATKEEFSEYEIRLASSLITRISEVARGNNAKLIVLDIPQVDGNGSRPSIVSEILSETETMSDFLVSNEVLKEYEGAVNLHVPNGHRHISAFTHAILGVEAAKFMARAHIDD